MFTEPIKSIQQAKEYFRAMGCSHFHMAREFPLRYEEYKGLNISKQQETEWRTERLDEYYTHIMNNEKGNPIWIVHSNMAELVETLKTDKALEKILNVTHYIHDAVPFEDRVIVSETINGRAHRQSRRGLIYLAFDLNKIHIAKSFIELSLHFSTYIHQKSRDFERCQTAAKLCNDIKAELGL